MRLLSSRVSRFLLAVVLILTPWWGPALALTGPDYTYEATEIVVEDNRLVIQDERALRHLSGVDGLACYYNRRATRYCALEAMTLNRSVEADHPDIVVSSAPLYADEWYLAYADGRVFQRHSVWEDGHYAIWTERMSATNALENISSSTAPYPQTATAIREGSVRTEERLWPRDGGAQIVREDGAYFVVYHTEQTQLLSSSPQVEAILTWLSVIVGTVVLFGRDTSHWL